MATITYDDGHAVTVPSTVTAAATGHGRTGPPLLQGGAGRSNKVVTGLFSFDNSYPTGGEDVSDIFNLFTSLSGLLVQDPKLSTGTGKNIVVDYSGKKLKLTDNAAAPAEVLNATDQSNAANLRFIAWGVA